jgi:hypothetical protein
MVKLNAGWGWVVIAITWLPYRWERDPLPVIKETGCGPGLVWMVVENLASAGVQILNHPAHSESLY